MIESTFIKCPKCGQENDPSSEKCTSCHVNLAWALEHHELFLAKKPIRIGTSQIYIPEIQEMQTDPHETKLERPFSPNSIQEYTLLPPPVKLWSAYTVGLITFVLGFPGGFSVAFIDWVLMKRTKKAFVNMVVLSAIFFGSVLISRLSQIPARGFILLVINLLILIYLADQIGKDIAEFKSFHQNVENGHWLGALLIGIGGWFILYLAFLEIAFIVLIIGFIFSFISSLFSAS